MPTSPSIRDAFTPTGVLRASITLRNHEKLKKLLKP